MSISAPSLSSAQNRFGWPETAANFLLLSIVIGFLPVLSGIVLRSYGYGMQPMWLESLRMMDFPDIFVEALIIIWARQRGMNVAHHWQIIPQHLKVAVAVFIATFWIGAVFISPIAPISIIRSSYWIIHLVFGLAVYHLVKAADLSSKIDVKQFVNWQVVGIAILTIITALHLTYIALLPASYAAQIKWSGAVPGCMSVRHFGILAGSVAALFAGYFCWTKPRQFNIPVAILICTFLIGLIIWSGTRAAAVGFVGAFLILGVAAKVLPPANKFFAILISAVFAILLSTPLLPPDPAFGFFRLFDLATQTDMDDISSGRIAIWHFVWNLFLDHWAFGWGEGAMHGIEIADTGLRHMQPHNAIFQFLYSWGVFAAGAMFLIIGSVMLRLHRKVALNFALAGPLMMADALLIMALFDGTLFFARMIMPLVFCIALCFAFESKSDDLAGASG